MQSRMDGATLSDTQRNQRQAWSVGLEVDSLGVWKCLRVCTSSSHSPESCDLGYLPSRPRQSRAERSGSEGCRKYVRLWLLQRNSWKKAGAPRSAVSVITAVRTTAQFAEVSSHSKLVYPRHDSSHITFNFHCWIRGS